jgi:hypothetical protein
LRKIEKMDDRELLDLLENNIKGLDYTRNYIANSSPSKYKWSDLFVLRRTLNAFSQIEFINTEIIQLKESALFSTTADEMTISSEDDTKIFTVLNSLRTGLQYILRSLKSKEKYSTVDAIMIKLPETKTFEDLTKISNDLKRGIELPISDAKTGEVTILTAESGSIWLLVYVGGAVNLVAAICWSAAVIRRKFAEARLFEQHARTLELKNNALEDLVNAQKHQLQNSLQAEAESIANKNYSEHNNENIERLKLSITTIADLIEKGAMILPAEKNNNELTKIFPDYNNLSLIESTIKQLKNSA